MMCFKTTSDRFRVSDLASPIGAITKHVFIGYCPQEYGPAVEVFLLSHGSSPSFTQLSSLSAVHRFLLGQYSSAKTGCISQLRKAKSQEIKRLSWNDYRMCPIYFTSTISPVPSLTRRSSL